MSGLKNITNPTLKPIIKSSIKSSIKGYKIFGPDYICRGYKYSDANTFHGAIELTRAGFHFAKTPQLCLYYYRHDPANTYAEVEAVGDIISGSIISVTNRLNIVKRLSYDEFADVLGYHYVKTPTGYIRYQRKNDVRHGFYEERAGATFTRMHYTNGLRNGIAKKTSGAITEISYYLNDALIERTTYEHGKITKHYNVFKCFKN